MPSLLLQRAALKRSGRVGLKARSLSKGAMAAALLLQGLSACSGDLAGSEQSGGPAVAASGSVTAAVSGSMLNGAQAQAGGTASPVLPSTPLVPTNPADPDNPVAYQTPQASAPELRARTWRLTHAQYQRSVKELVGVTPDVSSFPSDTGGNLFSNFSTTGFVREDLVTNYFATAGVVASGLTDAALAGFTTCKVSPSATCSDAFVKELGAKAFRRPLTTDELTTYKGIYTAGSAAGTPSTDGYRAVVKALLNSPWFLYRTEIGAAASETANQFSITDYEAASLLSYSLLGTPPTKALLDAAAKGALHSKEDIATQARALLKSADATAQLLQFWNEWLEVGQFSSLEKFEDVFKGFASVQPSMLKETDTFLRAHGNSESAFKDLLLAPIGSVATDLDSFYKSDASAPADLTRTGILGLGTVLSSHAKAYLTSPTLRGNFIRSRLFCQHITLPEGFAPPPLTVAQNKQVAKSTRELYMTHLTQPACASCHRQLDNLGFAMEGFDGAGRARTLDTTQGASAPIDTNSKLTDSDVNRSLSNMVDLAKALSESEMVRACLATQAFRFYFGQPESSSGLPAILAAHQALSQSGKIGDTFSALFGTDSSVARAREVMAP